MRYIAIKAFALSLLVTTVYAIDSRGQSSGGNTFHSSGRTFYIDNQIGQIIRANLLRDLDVLSGARFPEFANINVENLRARIPSIKVVSYSGDAMIGSGVRSDAINFTKQNFILLNHEKMGGYSPRQVQIMQWHEALGALGYDDENYLLSSTLTMRVADPQMRLSSVIVERFQKQFNAPLRKDNKISKQIEGGATGIGGGGDGETAEIKMLTLSYLNKMYSYVATSDFKKLNTILKVAIDTNIESKDLSDRYSKVLGGERVGMGVNSFDAKIDILVDTKYWGHQANGEISTSAERLLQEVMAVLKVMAANER